MPDMPKLPPFVYREKNRHGRWVTYFRRGKGRRTRLQADHGAQYPCVGVDIPQSWIRRRRRDGGRPTRPPIVAGSYARAARRKAEDYAWHTTFRRGPVPARVRNAKRPASLSAGGLGVRHGK